MTLKELYYSKGPGYYVTDKMTHHRYIPTYSELFAKWQHEPISILEVGCYKNGSLKLWEEFFTQATIIGVDIQTYEGSVELNRATVIIEDFYSSNRELPDFDLMIEDGPHDVNSQLAFVRKMYPKLKEGGLMIIEDVRPDYQPHFDTLGIPYTAIAFHPYTDENDDRILLFQK